VDCIVSLISWIEIEHFVEKEFKESSTTGDSTKDFTEGSSQVTLRRLKAQPGAIAQDPDVHGEGEAPDSWEQHLSPERKSLENLEELAERVGTLDLRTPKKNRSGAAKKRARRAKVAGAPAGGRTRPSQGSHTQALQELSSTGTQSKEKPHPGPQQGGPASPENRGSTKGQAKRQRSAGGTSGNRRAKRPKIAGPPSYAQAAREGIRMAIVFEGYPEVQVSKEKFSDIQRAVGGLVDGLPEEAFTPRGSLIWIGPKGRP